MAREDRRQLNGYSAGGKTGTAQKIDVVTHRYSKTEYVASFVGIAPVSNPAITVAVVIDSPKGDYYGTAAAAPVFRDVAQQVLEYLGVPHDTELKSQTLAAEAQEPEEPPPANQTGDLSALFDEVNDLPPNDPLRTEVNGQQLLPASVNDPSSEAHPPRCRPPGTHRPRRMQLRSRRRRWRPLCPLERNRIPAQAMTWATAVRRRQRPTMCSPGEPRR